MPYQEDNLEGLGPRTLPFHAGMPVPPIAHLILLQVPDEEDDLEEEELEALQQDMEVSRGGCPPAGPCCLGSVAAAGARRSRKGAQESWLKSWLSARRLF